MEEEIIKKIGFDKLGTKEITAIELRYLGNSREDVSDKTGIKIATLDEWFQKRGRLCIPYAEYTSYMNSKRSEKILDKIIETDENILAMTTNMMRGVGKNLKEPTYLKGLTIADFERAWKIQRIMTGKPVNYEKQDIEATITDTDKIIEKLGLTSKDFEDENFERTTRKISKLLESDTSV